MRPLSARNPRIQSLSRLVRKRSERAEQRALVVEGPVVLDAAIRAGLVVRDVYVDEERLGDASFTSVIDRLPASASAWSVPAGLLDRVGDVATSQGVLAVVDQPEATWPVPAEVPFVLVLAELQMPGNVGTLIRTAVASGAGAVVVAGGADPMAPKVVRASAGAIFETSTLVEPDPAVAIARLQADGYRVAAAVVDGGEPYDEADLTGPMAIVLGSEAHGLAPEVAAAADLQVSIPMAGPTESLNVAMAGTLLCFEVLRRQRAADRGR